MIGPSPTQQITIPLHDSAPLLKRKRETIVDSESEGEESGLEEEIGWIEEEPLTPEEVNPAEEISDIPDLDATTGRDRDEDVDDVGETSAGL